MAGTYPITITVTDSSMPPLAASASVSLRVNDSAIVIAPTRPPAGIVTFAYPGFGFSASGGSPPYTWKASGTLPPGLTFGSGGTLSGTPTQVGTYAFSVTATDGAQSPMSSPPLATRIVVNNPPLILNAMPAPPAGVLGTPYGPFAFSASGGFQPLRWSITAGNLPPDLTLGSDGSLSGTPTSAGDFMFTVTVTDGASAAVSQSLPFTINVAPPPPPSFTATGSMTIARAGHAATLLLSGKVLVTGGTADPTAELYDPATGTFTSTAGNMTESRSRHTATLLKLKNPAAANYGKVVIIGSGDTTAELYDPTTGMFAATGNLNHARISPTATLLNTGKLLIVGGSTTTNDPTAELYDPATGTFSFTGSTTVARNGHTATLLLSGKVLVTGGGNGTADPTAELYDPATGTFTSTAGNMTEPRNGHTATLLGTAVNAAHNGYVLIIGTDGSADLYDPSTQSFARVGTLPSGVSGARNTASLRDDGTVLIAGGFRLVQCQLSIKAAASNNTAALFAPESDGFTITASLNTPRDTHTATVLQDGTVLVVGGTLHQAFIEGFHRCLGRGLHALSSAELFK